MRFARNLPPHIPFSMQSILLNLLNRPSRIEKSTRKRIIRTSIKQAGVWFVDVPRTGSTSIKHDLVKQFGECFGKSFYREPAKGGEKTTRNRATVEAHSTATEVRKLIGAKYFDSVYTFSFVRNPFDRFFSLFHYRQLVGDLDRSISFKRYVCSLATPRFRDPSTPFFKRPYYLSMCDYLLDEQGQLIIDQWFKFENRNDSLSEIVGQTGVHFSGTHLERGKSLESYIDFYDSESKECLRTFSWV